MPGRDAPEIEGSDGLGRLQEETTLATATKSETKLQPLGDRVVIKPMAREEMTKSGIVLPDTHEIPVITGRVIAVSKAIENDEDQTIRQYDKVLP